MLGRPRYILAGGNVWPSPSLFLVKPRNLKKKSWQNNDIAKNIHVLIILFDTLILGLAAKISIHGSVVFENVNSKSEYIVQHTKKLQR